ncbi:helicase-related protein [Bauldia litoralis]|uniref:ATP-dependent RNA helicase SUPV3L1/SUV3 n=1 Tax=Bauldia litoralis TaxID=665467 RepID=A0A1G6AAD7_9HYPH|nr:helicase-related protein [Bauldia litoralis]SDB05407.1 ATP-dependent RNA helicase SUPV3L1/SUV3 [Bauldia litoralis]
MSFESISGAPSGGAKLVAVLGPTNTGKTHLAIERMLGHESGVIGLPLRLLAAEVYARVAARVGADQVALITGEEKIVPPNPKYRVCTVEAMPSETDAAFLAIDEIQLASDLERGHVFTDRMLHLRGRQETLLLGAATMHGIVERLFPSANVVTRPRMSVLSYSGSKKITRLPSRSAVVAFSADEVYAIAELIRRQRGGAAVVLGSLSPRARNAQVELFQSGDVDFLVATDAIGMGLNLDVDHVAFAADRKFDGFQFRQLTAAEFGQIAGRAGRHMRDGTFGVTSRVDPLPDELIAALESHEFDPVKTIQWRSRDLDFASIETLKASLDQAPPHAALTKAPPTVDVSVLETVTRDPGLRDAASSRANVALLWDVCQIPDYRKIAPANHAELVTTIFGFLANGGRIDDDWFARQVAFADHVEGDIDTLANRVAHIRTWTFAANRPHWLADPAHWQERTRAIEDRLSDALHERLTARFVDRRTSVLMRRLKEKAMLEAEITSVGDVLVEGQHIGTLSGFRFAPDAGADGPDAKALRATAAKSLAGEIAKRAEQVAAAPNADFALATDGTLRWQGAAIGRLVETEDALKPRLILLADDALTPASRERVQTRVDLWLTTRAGELLKPLFDLRAAENLAPAARGIAFRLTENFGVIERSEIAEEVRELDQDARAGLRALGVRFGAHHIYVPALLKPGPSALLATFWVLKHGGFDEVGGLTTLAASGRTSVRVDPAIPQALYRVVGYRVAGNMAIRIDILERLADQIRPLIAWRASPQSPEPPDGAVAGNGFTVTVAMTSLLGCSGEDFASVLRALGYRMERKPKPAQAAPTVEAAPAEGAPGEAAATTGESPAPVPATDGAPEAAPADSIEETPPAPAEAAPPEATAATAPPAEAAPETPDASLAPERSEEPVVAAETSDAVPASETDTPAAPWAEVTEPEEPAFIEVWRPQRAGRPGGRRGTQDRQGRDRQGQDRQARDGETRDKRPDGPRRGRPNGGENANGQKKGPRRPRRGDRGADGPGGGKKGRVPAQREERQKPMDPNSPFAALAALKAKLESPETDR